MRFAAIVAALFTVAATVALPDVWLQRTPGPIPPEGLFTTDRQDPGPWVCVADGCFTARGSEVSRQGITGRSEGVSWIINPDNPLTDIPLDDEGREEDIRIDDMRAFEDILYVQLNSGRIVTRTRDGVWRPGVAEFRSTTPTALVVAALVGLVTIAVGWLRARRVDAPLIAVAAVMAVLAHAPVTAWRHTTSYSLSTAGALSFVVLLAAVAVGYLAAGPRHSSNQSPHVGSFA